MESVGYFASQAQAMERAGRTEAALGFYLSAALLQALQLAPDDVQLWQQLGMALDQAGRPADAASAFRAALTLAPAFAEAWCNAGVAGSGEDAVAALRRAVALAPGRGDFHVNLAHVLLSRGCFAEGFAQWEWRSVTPKRDFAEPRWRGEDLAGRTLLVHAEQGFGDAIQFARYLPLAAKRNGRLLVEARAPLGALLARMEEVDGVIRFGDPLPPFDLQISLPSLASHFTAIPDLPYLRADPARVAAWREILGIDGRPSVGLVWSGNPRGPDSRRAVPPAAIAHLAKSLPEIRFVSLQRDVEAVPDGLLAAGEGIVDFDELAAALLALDELVSVDTASAHLAGALGRPCRVLLHNAADWRWWGPAPDRTVWYPDALLYRQKRAGDWDPVLDALIKDLSRDYSSR